MSSASEYIDENHDAMMRTDEKHFDPPLQSI